MKKALLTAAVVLMSSAIAYGATFTVTNTSDSGAGSLRQAILDANVAGGTVTFDIGAATHVIAIASILPRAEANVVIDGETQPGYGGRPVVEIRGQSTFTPCLSTRGVLRGLAISGCNVALYAEPGAIVEDNVFGLASDGITAIGNQTSVSTRTSAGTSAIIEIRRNIFSFAVFGLTLFAPAHVIGNHFGTTAAGNVLLSTLNDVDLYVDTAASGSTIGGPAPGDGNVLAGGRGFVSNPALELLGASGILVQANIIGVPGPRSTSGSTFGVGIEQGGSNNLILGNTITAFFRSGVSVKGGTANVISRNSLASNGIAVEPSRPSPFIRSVVASGNSTTIGGTITGPASTLHTIEVFDGSTCQSSETYLGTAIVTTGADGAATFQITTTMTLPAKSVLLATSTAAGANTSNFSQCFPADSPGFFGVDRQNVAENAGSAMVIVHRGPGVIGTVSVSYSTADLTAKAGRDYIATTGTLTFADGETAKEFSVPIIDDAVYSGDRTFFVNLSNPTGGSAIQSERAEITIIENDPKPVVAVSDIRVVEGNDGTRNAVLTLTAPSPINGHISYATKNGTATAGEDYLAEADFAFFDGRSSTSISIPIIGDTKVEQDETFTVLLAAALPSPDFTLGRTDVTVTIVNDDTGVGPSELRIPRGKMDAIVIDLGTEKTPQTLAFSSSDPNVAAVTGSAQITGTGFVTVMGNNVGHALITAVLPPQFGSATSGVDIYVYDPQGSPSVTSLLPAAAPVSGGTIILIKGSNLSDTCVVVFGGATTAATSATPESITVVAPRHRAGIVDVSLLCGATTVTLPQAFTYFETRGRAARH